MSSQVNRTCPPACSQFCGGVFSCSVNSFRSVHLPGGGVAFSLLWTQVFTHAACLCLCARHLSRVSALCCLCACSSSLCLYPASYLCYCSCPCDGVYGPCGLRCFCDLWEVFGCGRGFCPGSRSSGALLWRSVRLWAHRCAAAGRWSAGC